MGSLLHPRRPTDDGIAPIDLWLEREDRPRRFGRLRFLSVVMLVGLTVVMPVLGPNRYYVAIGICLIVAPLTLLIERKASVATVDQWHVLLDVFGICSYVFIIPSVYHGAAVIGTVAIASNGQYMGRVKYLLVPTLVAMMSVAGIIHEVDRWYLTVIAIGAAMGPALEFSKWYSIRSRLMLDRFALVTQSAGFLWEFSPAHNAFSKAHGAVESDFDDGERNLTDRLSEVETAVACAKRALVEGEAEELITLKTAAGRRRWFRLTATTRTRSDQSTVIHGFALDVTELEQARQLYEIRSVTDSLTRLPNRDGLVRFLESSTNRFVGIALMDLDGFKLVNDTMGHLAGDQVIAALGDRISRFAAKDVCVARLGGDEFAVAVVAPDQSAQARISKIAAAIVTELKKPVVSGDLELVISASIGTAGGYDMEWIELLRRADTAMYEAKRSVSRVVKYSEQSGSGNADRLALQGELAKGIEEQVELWFQPLVAADSRTIVGVEGLARWQHPERGIIGPDQFLPLIEAAGLMQRFDRHIVDLAAGAAISLEGLGPSIGVSANMSARSLWSTELVKQLESLPLNVRSQLTVELTEQGILDDDRGVADVLDTFRVLGLDLSLDDFGTGASSLIRLRALPFTEIKIDRSFVAGCIESEVDRAIVRSTIELAQELNLRTVAEGVETAEQADLLTRWGCTLLQGYYFGRPQPMSQLLETYQDSAKKPDEQPTVIL